MNIQNCKSAGALILGLSTLWISPLQAAGLIGIDFAGDIISLNTSTGVGTLIGATGVPGPSSLVSNAAGIFYTVSSDLHLYTINTTTGVATIGPAITGLGSNTLLNGLAFSTSGVLYADAVAGAANTNLYTINTITGAATLVGPVTPDLVSDIAFSPTGTLYAWDAAATNGGLMTVDTATGAGTLVKSGIAGMAGIRALRFDATGNFYGTGPANFFTINPTTSALTLIGPTGFTDIRGMAFTPVIYFPDLAFGGGYQTTLTYVNYSPQAVTCSTTFYSNSGSLLPIPFSQGTVTNRTDTLQPGQSVHDQSVANLTAPVSEGWAQASCTGPVQASVLFRLYQSGVAVSEASVNAETAPTTQFVTFAQTATGVAYANPSTTQSATVTFTVMSATGVNLGFKDITLNPLAHGSANLGPLLGLASFTGMVKITSTIPIISLSLNFEAFPVFSSLPPGDLPAGFGGGGGTTNYYFPDLAFGGGYQTTLTYVNYSPQAVTCSTTFYSNSGSLLPIPFSQGTVTNRTDTLQPGQSVHDQSVANLTAPVSEGWAQASCTGPVQASVLFRLYQSGVAVSEASVNAETAPTTQFVTFAQTATGVAYANPSTTQSATITFAVYNAAGTPLGSHVINLGPLAHGSANLGPLLGLQSFTGFVKITSAIPIISLALNFEAFPVFSSLPPGDLPGSTPLVTP